MLTLASEWVGFKWFWILDNLERADADEEEEEEEDAIFVDSKWEEMKIIFVHLMYTSNSVIYFCCYIIIIIHIWLLYNIVF